MDLGADVGFAMLELLCGCGVGGNGYGHFCVGLGCGVGRVVVYMPFLSNSSVEDMIEVWEYSVIFCLGFSITDSFKMGEGHKLLSSHCRVRC